MDEKIEKRMIKLIKNAKSLIWTLKRGEYNTEEARNLKQLGVDSFGFYSLPFLFTTENINGYMETLDLEGKDVLTVVGSGEQILNAIAKGAKKVDAFDISGYAILFYYLKEAAVKSLSYEEFIKFFLDKESIFDATLYSKLRENINPIALTFWDELYKEFGNEPKLIRNLFRKVRTDALGNDLALVDNLGGVSACWNREDYYRIRENLKNCEVNCFIRDVNRLDNIGDNYDYVFLSNILEYQKDNMEEFRASISRYISKLNNNGQINIGYFYGERLSEESFNLTHQSLELEGTKVSYIPSYYFSMFTPRYIPNIDRVIEYKKR